MNSILGTTLISIGLTLLAFSLALRIHIFCQWRSLNELKDRHLYLRSCMLEGGFPLFWTLFKRGKQYDKEMIALNDTVQKMKRNEIKSDVLLGEMEANVSYKERHLEFLEKVFSLVFTTGALLFSTGLSIWCFSHS